MGVDDFELELPAVPLLGVVGVEPELLLVPPKVTFLPLKLAWAARLRSFENVNTALNPVILTTFSATIRPGCCKVEYRGFWGLRAFTESSHTPSFKLSIETPDNDTVTCVALPRLNAMSADTGARVVEKGNPNARFHLVAEDPEHENGLFTTSIALRSGAFGKISERS